MPEDSARRSPEPGGGGPPQAVRLAALLAAFEGAALLVLGLVVAAKTVLGRPDSYGRALLDMLLAFGGGVLLLLLARGLARLRGWARSPVVVLQLLALPVGYSLAFQAGLPAYGGPVLLLAVAELYLLFVPQARAAFWER